MSITLLKIIAGVIVLLLIVVAAGVITHRYFKHRPGVSPRVPTVQKPELPPKPTAIPPPYEIYPEEDFPPLPPLPKPPLEEMPRVAIIVDDLGYDKRIATKFIALDHGLTFSILPFTPHSRKIAQQVRDNGSEVMLHLPMEPMEYPRIDPGPGALLTSMSPDELIAQLKKNLSSVPGARGVNNHMGSRLTTQSSQMYQIFTILKKEDLYFIDSRSTAESICRPSARMFQLPFAERDVFLDHIQEPEFIRKQIRELIRIARKHGEALGIVHPSQTSFTILKEMLPELKKEVKIVPAAQLVRVIS